MTLLHSPKRGKTAALAAALIGGLVLSSCAANADNNVEAQQVVVGLSTFSNDTALSWNAAAADVQVYDHVYDTLVNREQDTFAITPGLADSWTVSDDQLTYTFHLREDVPFHGEHGTLSSADVVFTVEKWLDPDTTGTIAQSFKSKVDSVEALDDTTVTVTLKQPDFAFLEVLSGPAWILSASYVNEVGDEEASRTPIGTGPYRYESRTAGSEIVFSKVPGHFLRDGGFESIILRALPDASTRVAAIQSDEVDLIEVTGDSLTQLESEGFQIFQNPNAQMKWVTLPGLSNEQTDDYRPELPWVGDPSDPESVENASKVRRALAMAIDKQAIIDVVFGGYGSTDSFGYWLAEGMPGHSAEWEPLPYDPDAAKALLAEAGHSGLQIVLTDIGQVADTSAITQAVAQYWEAIGVSTDLRQKDFAAVGGDIRSRIKDSYAFVYTNPGALSLSAIGGLHSDNAFRFAVQNEKLDGEIDAILREQDESVRAERIEAVMGELVDNQYGLQLGMCGATFAASDDIADWKLSMGNGSFHNYEYLEPAGNQ